MTLQAIATAGTTFRGVTRYGDVYFVAHTCEQEPMIKTGQPSVLVEGQPIAHSASESEVHTCMDVDKPLDCKKKHTTEILATTTSVFVGAEIAPGSTTGRLREVARIGDPTQDRANLPLAILQKDVVRILPGRVATVFAG